MSSTAEAEAVTRHYVDVLDKIQQSGLAADVSIKLTQLGLDVDHDLCLANLRALLERTPPGSMLWIDMESALYVDKTMDLYVQALADFKNVGVCLQAYLYRTVEDFSRLRRLGPAIRLVKGAYLEPVETAYARQKDVDGNFLALAESLLSVESRQAGVRPSFATHDRRLLDKIGKLALACGAGKNGLEFQMLFGIQQAEQMRLAKQGWRSTESWFPWFVRRLAERPANVAFLLRNMVVRRRAAETQT